MRRLLTTALQRVPRIAWGSLRFLLMALLVLPVLAFVLLGGAVLWANTEGGRGFIARQAGALVPGLSIDGLTGPLPGRIGVARLSMADEAGAWLELEDATVALDLMALLRRDLRITAVTARRVALHRLPPATEPPPPPDPDAPLIPSLPSLPVAVHLDRLAVERIELGAPVMGVAAVLALEGTASLDAGALAARLDARRIDAPAEARLVLDLAPGADRLVARLDASEPAGGLLATALGLPDRAARAQLSLDGPASGARLDLDVALGEDVTVTAQGEVSAAPDGAAAARLDLRLAVAPLLPEDLRAVAMPATVALDAGIDAARRVALRRLALRVPAGEVTAEGSADLAAETLDITARASIGASTVLGALVPPVARWSSLGIDARATGAMRTPRIALDAAVQGFGSDTPALVAALGETPRIALRATLPERIESLAIDGAALRVTAEGDVGETLDATLRVVAADLAPLVPGLTGGLEAQARLTGPRTDPSIALTARGERLERDGQVLEAPDLSLSVATPLSAPRAEGTLRATYAGLPATLDLHGVPEGENLRIERLAFAFGPARLDARGLLDPRAATFAGDVTLDVADLAPFSTLAGTPMTGRAGMRATLDLRDGAQGFDATAEVPQARIAGTAVEGRLAAKGTLAALEASLEARADDARLTTRLSVAPDGTARRIEVPDLLLRRGPRQPAPRLPRAHRPGRGRRHRHRGPRHHHQPRRHAARRGPLGTGDRRPARHPRRPAGRGDRGAGRTRRRGRRDHRRRGPHHRPGRRALRATADRGIRPAQHRPRAARPAGRARGGRGHRRRARRRPAARGECQQRPARHRQRPHHRRLRRRRAADRTAGSQFRPRGAGRSAAGGRRAARHRPRHHHRRRDRHARRAAPVGARDARQRHLPRPGAGHHPDRHGRDPPRRGRSGGDRTLRRAHRRRRHGCHHGQHLPRRAGHPGRDHPDRAPRPPAALGPGDHGVRRRPPPGRAHHGGCPG
jgi:autotransporter translocation and assembly factor TamB